MGITLKDVDSLDDGSFDKMLEEAGQITSDREAQLRLVAEKIAIAFRIRRLKDIQEEGENMMLKRHAAEEGEKCKKLKEEERKEGKRKVVEVEDKELMRRQIKEGKRNGVGERDKTTEIKKIKLGWQKSTGSKKRSREDEARQLKRQTKIEKINTQGAGLDRSLCIPTALRNHLEQKGITVSDTKLVIAKKLFKTDVSASHSRLSVPLKQVMCDEFLTADEEVAAMKEEGMDVMLIEPCLNERPMRLRKWRMTKCLLYSLISGWSAVLRSNAEVLQEDAFVQLRCFRHNGQLWFAVSEVVLPAGAQVHGSGSGESCSNDANADGGASTSQIIISGEKSTDGSASDEFANNSNGANGVVASTSQIIRGENDGSSPDASSSHVANGDAASTDQSGEKGSNPSCSTIIHEEQD